MPSRLSILTQLHGRQAHSILNARAFKNGGLWFIRVGRFQVSFCLCRTI